MRPGMENATREEDAGGSKLAEVRHWHWGGEVAGYVPHLLPAVLLSPFLCQ